MKTILSSFLLFILALSCAYKKEAKENYAPVISFQEAEKTFEAKIHFPEIIEDKVPLVIVVHEWWGRTPYIMDRAEMLTKEGYASLAVDLFGNNKTVLKPTEAQALAAPFYKDPELGVSRLKKYLEIAKRNPYIDEDQIYVIGYCFGGTQALNLARSGIDIEGVVSFHGVLDSAYPTKDIKAEILVLNGGADPMVPPKDIAAFKKEMNKANADFKIITYPDALHAFTNPVATELGNKYEMPIAYNKVADEASWKELLKYLKN